MKKSLFTSVAALIIVSFLLAASGCYGSFGLVKKVYKFNEGLGNKWTQEVGFLVMSIVPVYEGAAFIDAIVLNSIEFWTGNNPVAATLNSNDGSIKVAYDKESGSIQLIQGNTQYSFEKSKEGTIVKDKEGNIVFLCIATDDGGMVLKDIQGKTVATYTGEQVQNLYTSIENVR
jgi:hypothetical protein